jgi:membrane protein insertase Oxa1/YidC/SpoIIIJ
MDMDFRKLMVDLSLFPEAVWKREASRKIQKMEPQMDADGRE